MRFEVELDSMLIVQMLQGQIQMPWRLEKIHIEDIRKKMHQRNIISTHCYRENSKVVDATAKYATTYCGRKKILDEMNTLIISQL